MRSLIKIAAVSVGLSLATPHPIYAADLQPLKLAKECSAFTGKAGDHCTITESNLPAIPVGAQVFYYGPVMGPVILASIVVVDDAKGNTAIGSCNVDLPKSSGTCTFWAGSGKLAGFNAIVTLTIDDKGLFHWDGGFAL